MIKYNHTHLPAKRHTGLFKPCYGGNNAKITVRPLDFLNTLGADFSESIKKDFLHTFKNLTKPHFKRLPQNGATSNILGVINDFSEQYAHARDKHLPNSAFETRNLATVNSLINSAFQMRNSINALTNSDNEAYYKDLSKQHSDTPNRYLLAFFVLKNWYGSQPNQHNSTKQSILSQDKTIIAMANLPLPYDGVTLQNTRAFKVNMQGGYCVTKSEPHQPMFNHKLVLTQNNTGGNHA